MKVFVINFHHVLNYGAVFQGYALCKFLNDEGYETKLIDYRPFYFLFQTYRPAKGVLKTFRKLKMALNFYDFRKKHFQLTDRPLYTEKGLRAYFDGATGAFICGSDQVWNANLTNGRLDPGYFLDFVPLTGRKIAYAASIGHTRFDRSFRADISRRLNSYKAISVREDFARKEVIEITDRKISPLLVLDPTLIMENYHDVLDYELVPDNDYIVVYTTENSDNFRAYIKEVNGVLGMQVINLGHYNTGIKSTNYSNIHPCKWLGLFAKASYVCTNSFHGTAFSIAFRRNFTVLGRDTFKELNRRQLTLMQALGVEDRFIDTLEQFNQTDHLGHIDYEKVDNKLYTQRKISRDFLLNALNQ